VPVESENPFQLMVRQFGYRECTPKHPESQLEHLAEHTNLVDLPFPQDVPNPLPKTNSLTAVLNQIDPKTKDWAD
jgi:hypothetical protein